MFCLNTKGLTRVLEQNAWEEIPATGAQTADVQAATATTKDVFGQGCCFFFKVCASISTLQKYYKHTSVSRNLFFNGLMIFVETILAPAGSLWPFPNLQFPALQKLYQVHRPPKAMGGL